VQARGGAREKEVLSSLGVCDHSGGQLGGARAGGRVNGERLHSASADRQSRVDSGRVLGSAGSRTSGDVGRAIAGIGAASRSVLANVGGGDVLRDAASRACCWVGSRDRDEQSPYSRWQYESTRTSSNRGRAVASVDRSSGSVLANVGGGDVLRDTASRTCGLYKCEQSSIGWVRFIIETAV